MFFNIDFVCLCACVRVCVSFLNNREWYGLVLPEAVPHRSVGVDCTGHEPKLVSVVPCRM